MRSIGPALPPSSAGPPILRPYQAQVVRDTYEKMRQGYRRIAIVAGTGAGKTVIGGQICAHARELGLRLMFLVHLDVLVGQTYQKLQDFGLECGFIKAGWPEKPDAPIQIASVQTMARRDWWRTWPADLVFYDEAHTTVFSEIGRQVMEQTHAGAVHLAMTATPYRLGREQLGDRLETLVAAPPPATLQAMGFLAQMKYYSLPAEGQIDLNGVRLVAGDFNERDLKNACDRPELVARIVAEWQRLTPGKRTIAFCVDVEHAKHVAAAFRAIGVPSESVDGSTPIKERDRLYRALGSGELLVLTSCNVISIGFDEPSVEVGLLLRPTQSLALHYQQIGRVMRISPASGKTCGLILDQAGNLQRLGFPEEIQHYDLPVGEAEIAPLNEAETQYKPCPDCATWLPNSLSKCPDCGHLWLHPSLICAEELVELLSPAELRAIEDEPTLIKLFHFQRRRAVRRGDAPLMADRAFYAQTGKEPQPHWYRGSVYGDAPTENEVRAYRVYLSRVAQRTGRPPTWVFEELEKEFGPPTTLGASLGDIATQGLHHRARRSA